MNNFEHFYALSEQDRKDAFDRTARDLNTETLHIEKDFWVCWVLDALYNHLPETHPRLLFKGGTALSKAFELINRFSEDIDIVVYRDYLGFESEQDPTNSSELSGKKRKKLFEELQSACSDYVLGILAPALESIFGEYCHIVSDEKDQQTLLVSYPTLYQNTEESSYVLSHVKIEAGARSALDPNTTASIRPYIARNMTMTKYGPFEVANLHVIEPARTYLDKLLILHGFYCGYRGEQRLPKEGSRIARHYYDVAMMTEKEAGKAALADHALLKSVREHNIIAFRQAWKCLKEAVPGTLKLVPQVELREVIERDYEAMRRMIFGTVPSFDWIMEQLQTAETAINQR